MRKPYLTVADLWEARIQAQRRKERVCQIGCLILIPILALTGVVSLFLPQ